MVLCTGQKHKASESAPRTSQPAPHTDATTATTTAMPSDETSSTNMSAGGKQNTETTSLQTVSVWICNDEKQVKVRAMFDNGAQRSYIREEVARKLYISAVGN